MACKYDPDFIGDDAEEIQQQPQAIPAKIMTREEMRKFHIAFVERWHAKFPSKVTASKLKELKNGS